MRLSFRAESQHPNIIRSELFSEKNPVPNVGSRDCLLFHQIPRGVRTGRYLYTDTGFMGRAAVIKDEDQLLEPGFHGSHLDGMLGGDCG